MLDLKKIEENIDLFLETVTDDNLKEAALIEQNSLDQNNPLSKGCIQTLVGTKIIK